MQTFTYKNIHPPILPGKSFSEITFPEYIYIVSCKLPSRVSLVILRLLNYLNLINMFLFVLFSSKVAQNVCTIYIWRYVKIHEAGSQFDFRAEEPPLLSDSANMEAACK